MQTQDIISSRKASLDIIRRKLSASRPASTAVNPALPANINAINGNDLPPSYDDIPTREELELIAFYGNIWDSDSDSDEETEPDDEGRELEIIIDARHQLIGNRNVLQVTQVNKDVLTRNIVDAVRQIDANLQTSSLGDLSGNRRKISVRVQCGIVVKGEGNVVGVKEEGSEGKRKREDNEDRDGNDRKRAK